MINWIPVMYSVPVNDDPVLMVCDDPLFRAIGKPSAYVDVGFYEKDSDSFVSVLDDAFRGEVFFWAPLPDIPHALMHNVFSRPSVNADVGAI